MEHSPSLVKEVVRDQDAVFANRDVSIAANIASYGGNDIGWSKPNSQWRNMRKIFIQEMMVSNKSLETSYNLRKDEVRKTIIDLVHTKKGKPIEIGELSFRTELNVILNMLWGGIIGVEEGERIGAEFRVLISKIIDLFGKPNISDFYPGLAGLDIQGVKKQMENYMQSMDNIFNAVIALHKHKLSGGVKKRRKERLSPNPVRATGEKGFRAWGTDTTATTVEWAMAKLMNNPEVMAKAQKELSDVVGLNNMIEESHMPDLKYLEAVIKETLHLHPTLPLLVPRSPAQSSTIGGYTIPKNSRVIINIWSIQRDPSIWDNSNEFRPERFMDDNGKLDFGGNNFHYLRLDAGERYVLACLAAERMLVYIGFSFAFF
ncbi:hypothetical protein DH2020_004899 [Rehmannia glutinosa]|uniref:Uncharacterized protein n=1 Tax=Rehmannia glutinosa TaxID=99300 RepID=A0ABR0XR03_REHGL